MDATTLRLLLRLSVAVSTFVSLVVGTLLGVELPFGRAGRGLTILGGLGSAVAILLLTARLARSRQPESPLAKLSPEVLYRGAIGRTRSLAGSSRARSSAAMHRRRRAPRVRQTEIAALEAAEVDDRLAPESIRTSAEALLRLVYLAWDARDPVGLAALVDPQLLPMWERAMNANEAAGRHHRARVPGHVEIDLVSLTADGAGKHTAVVLVEAELEVGEDDLYGKPISPEGGFPGAQRLCQYWTLTLREDEPWRVHAVEERDEGDRHLTEPIAARAAGI